MEDTLHKRLKAFGLDDLQILGVQALIATSNREARLDGAKRLLDLHDSRTVNPLAPDHDNYIIKVAVADEYISALSKEAQT
jgi:hypothetical protein